MVFLFKEKDEQNQGRGRFRFQDTRIMKLERPSSTGHRLALQCHRETELEGRLWQFR